VLRALRDYVNFLRASRALGRAERLGKRENGEPARTCSSAALKFALDAGMPETFFAAVAEWDGAQWGAPTVMLVRRGSDEQLRAATRDVTEVARGGGESLIIRHAHAQTVTDA
jgi:hypothetical protein